MLSNSTGAIPPGHCGIHGYHGRTNCPKCSTSTLPFTPLIQSAPVSAAVSPACPKCGTPGAANVTHVCLTAGEVPDPPATRWLNPSAAVSPPDDSAEFFSGTLADGLDEPVSPAEPPGVQTGPHPFRRRGWRWWICAHCYAPRKLHPRNRWVRSRPLGDNRYLSPSAPHFKEGW